MQKTETPGNNLFLLGAGFTKAVFDNAPLNKDLVNELLTKNPNSKLKKYSGEFLTNNIEILLTYLDIKILSDEGESDKRREYERDRADINKELADYFKQFRFNENVIKKEKWLKPFAEKVFQQNDLVVNLNYDCFLEGMLDFFQVWTFDESYRNMIGPFHNDFSSNPKNIKIYKIHGSENFRKATCLGENGRTFIKAIINSDIFPKSGKGKDYNNDHRDKPYVIAPSFVKIPHETIVRWMNEVLDKVKSARNFIMIGCGMRSEDSFLWLLLTKFLDVKSKNNQRKIIIVDPKSEEIEQKIQSFYFVNINANKIKNSIENSIDDLLKLI